MHGGVDTAGTGGEDTDPLRIVDEEPPQALSGGPLRPLTDLSYEFAPKHHSPRSWPRLTFPRRMKNSLNTRAVVAAASLIAAAAAVTWLLWPGASAPTVPPPPTGDGAEQLRPLGPAGFGDSCRPQSTTPPLVAHLTCTTNSDLSGPATARFMLAQNDTDLQDLLRENLAGAQVVVCPGNIASPGPWRRNAAPSRIAGTLVCAMHGQQALIAWSTDAHRLVSTIESDTSGPTLAQLYAWWTSHS